MELKWRVVCVVAIGQTCEREIDDLADLTKVIDTLPALPISVHIFAIGK